MCSLEAKRPLQLDRDHLASTAAAAVGLCVGVAWHGSMPAAAVAAFVQEV